ncbi:MAG TPA: pyridoxal-phosphate dependent enzyme [Verrucomicrobiales bacterium]|nr:pyridoxal-phosphate dependent enzyme [Verrucomicrobiales bacterium]
MIRPTFQEIQDAYERISTIVHWTPVLRNRNLNRLLGKDLYFKCENFQKCGAFKFRGATNVVMNLSDEELSRGVATHSSGNHAGALAAIAEIRDIRATVVMPENASRVKVNAVREYGAEIRFCASNTLARETCLEGVLKETGAVFVPPYNDYRIIAGQATVMLEFIEQVGGLDTVVAPVGGGGLLSGTARACAFQSPETSVIGAEPKGADDAMRSFTAKRLIPMVSPVTIADGLLTSLGEKTFPIILSQVDGIITVKEDSIIHAMRLVWERLKIIVEPSAAVPLAAILENPQSVPGSKVGIILSGGNVDLNHLPWKC